MKAELTIGEAAAQTGVSAKMIRHYEAAGLLSKPIRTDSGYRLYGPAQLQQLQFIRQARLLGFALSEIASLLKLWQDPGRCSRDVKQLAQQHLACLSAKLQQLMQMQQLLQQLVAQCDGDLSPDCAILAALAAPLTAASTTPLTVVSTEPTP